MNIKMIALDLDGTLNTDDKKITPKTKAALIKVQELGVTVVLASGRPAKGLYRERKELDLDKYNGVLLSSNGGKVTFSATDIILYEKAMPNELAVKLLRHLEKFDVSPIVDNGSTIYTTDEDAFKVQYEVAMNQMDVKVVDNIADAIDFSPMKVLIASPEEKLRPVEKEIMEPFDDIEFVYSTPFFLESTVKGISKGKSLELICDKLGIKKEEVMAFGDGGNDKSMLEFAGIGIAMGNACEPLKAVANEITLSNNEDGIAYTLAKYFPEIIF